MVTITREGGPALCYVGGSTPLSSPRNTTFISFAQESLSAKNMSQTDVSAGTPDLGIKHRHPDENRRSCLFKSLLSEGSQTPSSLAETQNQLRERQSFPADEAGASSRP